MTKIFFDSNEFSTFKEFLLYAEKKLISPSGHEPLSGLDALEDTLEGGFGVFEYDEKVFIKWCNFRKTMKEFGYEATVIYYTELLSSCHPSNRLELKAKITQAEKREGMTLFFMILECFFDAENISLELY